MRDSRIIMGRKSQDLFLEQYCGNNCSMTITVLPCIRAVVGMIHDRRRVVRVGTLEKTTAPISIRVLLLLHFGSRDHVHLVRQL